MKKNKILNFIVISIFIGSIMIIGSLSSTTHLLPSISNSSLNAPNPSNPSLSTSTYLHLPWGINGLAVSTHTDSDQWVHAVSDGAGGIIICWVRYDTNDEIYVQRVDSNGNILWDANGTLASNSGYYKDYPKVCSDEVGGAIVTWEESRGVPTGFDIYAQRISSAGTLLWGANGTTVCNSTGNQNYVQICSDKENGAVIAWTDNRNGNQDIYAQRVGKNGITSWTPNGTVMSNSTDNEYTWLYPGNICSDGSGGAIVTWLETTGFDSICAQHVDLNGVTQWGVGGDMNGTVICNFSLAQDQPTICSDGAGGAIITWHGYRPGTSSSYDISVQHLDSSGKPQWGSNGTVICNASNLQWYPVICEDGSGGAIIAWLDQRNVGGDDDIYAQRINSAGTQLWGANGTLICNEINDQTGIAICNDTKGGAIISWADKRNNVITWNDLYTQWINSTGNTIWGANGTLLASEADHQGDFREYRPYCASDGNGGSVIAWMDSRSGGGNWDIYAQHITNLTNNAPTSSLPPNVNTTTRGNENITWTLSDDFGGGMYRVWANDTNGNYYVWKDWTSWTASVPFNVNINRTAVGIFNYTIEYYDSDYEFGNPTTVIVTVTKAQGILGPGIFLFLNQIMQGEGGTGALIAVVIVTIAAAAVILYLMYRRRE